MDDTISAYIARRRELCSRIKSMIVNRLDLPVDVDWITDDQPLFGRGLELDSVDALELVSSIEYEFDIAVQDDDVGVFGSVNTIADYIERHARTEELSA